MTPSTRITSLGWLLAGAVVVLSGWAAAGWVLWQRDAFEASQNSVAVVLDYSGVQKVARVTGEMPWDWLLRAKGWGYTNLAVEEDTLESLESDGWIQVLRGSDLLALRQLSDWQDDHPIRADRVYVLSKNSDLLDRMEEGFRHRFLSSWQRFYADLPSGGSTEVVEVPADLWDGAMKMGVGYGAATLDPKLRKFHLYPRVNNFLNTTEVLEHKFKTFQVLPAQGCLIFSGIEVPGYPREIQQAAKLMKGLEHNVCLAEMVEMDGLSSFKAAYPGAIRLHSIPEEEMKRFNMKRFHQRYVRAAKERHIRVLYVRPATFYKLDELKDLNRRYLKGVLTELKKAGFRLGEPSTFEGFSVPAAAKRWCLFAALTLAMMLGVLLLEERRWPLLSGLGLAAAAGVTALAGTTSLQLLVALVAAIGCAGLPLFVLTARLPYFMTRGFTAALAAFWIAVLTALCGGMLINAAFAGSAAMQGLIAFRGIKLMLVLPVFMMLVAWAVSTEPEGSFTDRLKGFFATPPTRGELAAAGILLVAALLMVLRSGNDTGLASGFELILRDRLELAFGVRPRTKEFLIGYPALLGGLYLLAVGRRNLVTWGLLILGVTGPASMVNTFAHLHTPVALSVSRSLLGIVLGLCIGLMALVPLRLLLPRMTPPRG